MNKHYHTIKRDLVTAMQYILVIDNELIDRKKLTDVMNRLEHYVLFAQDTVNALKLLTEVRPVMVIVGFMEGRPDRQTFTRIIKSDESTAEIQVVALSENDSLLSGMMPIGFDGMITIRERGQDIAGDIKNILANRI
jgi:CheY-like chemotaxis protein